VGESPDDLVTVAAYRQVIDASVMKSVLDGHGVECWLADENMVTMDWMYSDFIGGVKLQVRRSDLEDARRILKEGAITEEGMPCPACGSKRTRYERYSRKLSIFSFFFMLPFTVPKNEWLCLECSRKFTGKEQ
jgi:DNA-directed RNA polymerase subunit RPC12/RpoP